MNFKDKKQYETIPDYIARKHIQEKGCPEVVVGIIIGMVVLSALLLK